MALSFLARDISDLCLGKPPLRGLPVSTTVADTISAMKICGESFISIWACNHTADNGKSEGNNNNEEDDSSCECVGKVCTVDVVRYLCTDDKNLSSPSEALKAPVSVLSPKAPPALVLHVLPSCSLVEAMDIMAHGTQNLVVPIRTRRRRHYQPQSSSSSCWPPLRTTHKHGRQFCWITQEDIVRFLLGSIAAFSPLSSVSLHDLRLISSALSLDFSSPPAATFPALTLASSAQTGIAVVHKDDVDAGKAVLLGEISPYALNCLQDESVAAALATLSAGELMVYLDYGGSPPEELLQVVRTRLLAKGLKGMVNYLDDDSRSGNGYSSSSDDEFTVTKRCSSRKMRGGGMVVCGRRNSLAAVMIQAIVNGVNYVWVVEGDGSLVGIVTFVEMLGVFRDYLKSMG